MDYGKLPPFSNLHSRRIPPRVLLQRYECIWWVCVSEGLHSYIILRYLLEIVNIYIGFSEAPSYIYTICISQIATKCTCPFLDKTLWLDLFICDIVYSFWTTKDFFVQTGSFDPFFRPPPAGYAGEIFCSFFDRSIYILFMYMKGKALRKKKMSKNLKKTCSNVRYMKFIPYGMYWESSPKMLPKCGNYVRRWYVTGVCFMHTQWKCKKNKKIKRGRRPRSYGRRRR